MTKKTKPKRNTKTGKTTSQKSKIQALKENKILIIILITTIILGTYLRLTDYAQEGIRADSITTLTGGILWFYPHSFYPGLIHYQPPVGHYMIGKSCMLSGEDFSEVSKASPFFIPTMATVIGKSFPKAENSCFIIIYLSSLLVFLGLIMLSYTLLETKSFIYATTFFAFFSSMLFLGRMLIVEVITWLFAVYALLTLWKFYTAKKGSKKELIYFTLSAIMIALAITTKFTAALLVLFSILLLTEKYYTNLKTSLKRTRIPKPPLYNAVIFTIILTITLLIPFQMNPQNLKDVYTRQTSTMGGTEISLSLNTLDIIKEFTTKSNPIDTILILYSIYILYILLTKKQKSPQEKYILYLTLFFIASTTLFAETLGYRRAIIFFFGIPLLMSLAFSGKEYSIFNKIKIFRPHKKTIFITIILIYIASSITLLYPIKPYYSQYKNPLICPIFKNSCEHITPSPIWKPTADELNKLIKENETYYMYPENPDMHLYIKHESYYKTWSIKEAIEQQKKDKATLEEIIRTYNYFAEQNNEKPIKYLVIRKQKDYTDPLAKNLIDNIQPAKTVKINNIEVSYIYDIETFTTR